MREPVQWRADGVPRSERFDDIYHTETGALAQSRHVFLGGCGLPEAWRDQPQWRILETGFGFGFNFLTTWQAWRTDPARPRMLHFVSIEAHPVGVEDLLRAASAYPELAELARALAGQWTELLSGFHRMSFDDGHVLLTLCIGDVQAMLRAQRFEADSLYLDGFSPDRNPAMWSPETLKAVSRFARRGSGIATWTIARAVRDALAQNGFQVRKAPGLPPKRDCLRGVFDPAWTPRRRTPPPEQATPGRCAVIGAGLAGAAVAASLARRGWQVDVFDKAAQAATGASGLPVGVLAPHVSPDDALLSRLTRAGIRATWQQLQERLVGGRDWKASGVLERRPDGDLRLPPGWRAEGPNLSWPANAAQLAASKLPADTAALWHPCAGWVRPRALVEAWLATPGVHLIPDCEIERIAPTGAGWQLLTHGDPTPGEFERVVIAAGFESARFAPSLPLQPVRGQVQWGHSPCESNLPPAPINGDGHLIAGVPDGDSALWLTGATFDRDSIDLMPSHTDTEANRERLARLCPQAASALASAFEGATPWTGVRCASGDRRPLIGPLPDQPGLWVCTALGSRGLTFATLCAELLAAHWHAEPLPLPTALAQALDTRRL
ncbi:FAD-dependent 5-carboxymethylaminomethyl-2-thiouridine(34) oxidoreductase MnmC [Variovorax rhizosphaerae]|uniref:tRNA 5-methylaminomethyl-2-thiouridine biosynthesis bifunctional protein MnmC n=1 Tax=Variovorax rhizosphaerae TaxID=1836200 RepID=A0ABU8WL57_9BURK